MKTPQDKNEELKERLAGVPEDTFIESQVDFRRRPTGKLCHEAYKRIVELEKENAGLRDGVASLAASACLRDEQPKLQWITDRRPTEDDAFQGKVLIVIIDAIIPSDWKDVLPGTPWIGKNQLPSPEPAWTPKYKVGDRVDWKNKYMCGGKIISLGGAELQQHYEVKWPGISHAIFESESDLEAAPWTLTPPPFGRWHRSDGWKEEWLNDGWRPLMEGEMKQRGDKYLDENGWADVWFPGEKVRGANLTRTKRPLPEDPVEKAWKAWLKGSPFDPRAKAHFTAGWNARQSTEP